MPERIPTIGATASLAKRVTEEDVASFAAITGDFNPLHMDSEFASKSRFGERIAHGLLVAGLISAVLGTKLPGPGSIYLSQSLGFRKPVRIGDTITARVTVTDYDSERRIVTLETGCQNQDGVVVLTGEARLLLEEA